MRLRISLITPAARGSSQGNRITAIRWALILRSLGHRVRVDTAYRGEDADLLIALHARRSASAVRAFRRRNAAKPVIVALTGTDLYRDLPASRAARESLAAADRLVLLQRAGRARLPSPLRSKARVIHQGAAGVPRRGGRNLPLAPSLVRRGNRMRRRFFDVCVLSHLRPVKDPFRAALAARRLPAASRIRVLHAGRALSVAMAARARAEAAGNPRYRWLGERSHAEVRALLARCRLLVLSSRLEGGANVIGEAAVAGVPILASHIEGSSALLGRRYPGFFSTGDTAALAALLRRAETDACFYRRLRRAVRHAAPLFSPTRERDAWRRLLREVIAT